MTNTTETLAEEVCRIAHPGRWDFVPAPRWPCQGCQDVAPVIANSIEKAKAGALREAADAMLDAEVRTNGWSGWLRDRADAAP